jgi:hypothetical protein
MALPWNIRLDDLDAVVLANRITWALGAIGRMAGVHERLWAAGALHRRLEVRLRQVTARGDSREIEAVRRSFHRVDSVLREYTPD